MIRKDESRGPGSADGAGLGILNLWTFGTRNRHAPRDVDDPPAGLDGNTNADCLREDGVRRLDQHGEFSIFSRRVTS